MKINSLENLILSKLQAKLAEKKIVILGIDGPTASGKTILANNLGKALKEKGLNVDYYRLDWQLKKRDQRIDDLKRIKESGDEFFLEGEMHMHLEEFDSILRKINLINQSKEFSENFKESVAIENLYNREDNGNRTGNYCYELTNEMVLICEGHYTSRAEYSGLIDVNICLLAEEEELLNRKIRRVSGYRGAKEAEEYFYSIDIPSFKYHLKRYFSNIDLILDNTNYSDPVIVKDIFLRDWLKTKKSFTGFMIKGLDEESQSKENQKFLFDSIFSVSRLDLHINEVCFNELLTFSEELEKITSVRLLSQSDNPEFEITSNLEKAIITLNENLRSKNIHNYIELATKNSFHIPPRERRLPLSIGINLFSRNNRINKHFISILYNIYNTKCEIILSWKGGTYKIYKTIDLSGISDRSEVKVISKWNKSNQNHIVYSAEDKSIKLFTPTDYCIPSFIKGFKFEKIYTGKEHELTAFYSIFDSFIKNNNSVLVHRFSEFSELNYYKSMLENCGCITFRICNYLISIRSYDASLCRVAREFKSQWILEDSNEFIYEKSYDNKINQELLEAKDEVTKMSSIFTLTDTFLVLKQEFLGSEIDIVIKELKNLLKSKNRTLRKRAFQYIQEESPYLSIAENNFLKCFGIDKQKCNSKEEIQVRDIYKYYPSIMAELYLWQHIRGDNSAILAANIYDLRGDLSLDAQGVLEASTDSQTAVVLQASFNALGQQEEYNQKPYQGYLECKDGASTLTEYCIRTCVYNYHFNGVERPLYGIGLDHVDSRNDLPKGRAKRFLNKAMIDKNITHIVLDGSSRFNALKRDSTTLSAAYQEVVNYETYLLTDIEDSFLVDKEYCIGELSYIGDSDTAMIPSSEEINLFIKSLRKSLYKINFEFENCRPSLFIGNVGTTHHGKDLNLVNSSISYSWVENAKKYGFISAVLHGTTNSSGQTLSSSTSGCHKVNVAGDFLKVFQGSLPLGSKYTDFTSSSKYLMPEISTLKKQFKEEEKQIIKNSVRERAKEIISSIKSPVLTQRDQLYFHRFSYYMPDNLINLILDSFKNVYIKRNNSVEELLLNQSKNGCFSASMIEVPFEDGFCDFADALIKAGIKYFHIDVGDGKFISRSFSGIEKIKYLLSITKDISIHAHLMVENPLEKRKNKFSYIEDYVRSGVSRLAMHSRSFPNNDDLIKAINLVKSLNCIPGIIIEVHQHDLQKIWNFIIENNLKWVVLMGVPTGYGGQLFQPHVLDKLYFLRKKALEENYTLDLEIDGGLNMSNIRDCYRHGANIFAGWSIIKSNSRKGILDKYSQLTKLIS
tara:strand:+ start:2957 stop:6862 length:3906 start_codon:yes stop_codon:yes gene_type:complete